MDPASIASAVSAIAPIVCLLAATACAMASSGPPGGLWRVFQTLSLAALVATVVSLAFAAGPILPGLQTTAFGMWLSVLVQLLGTVIGGFSARYLEGEAGQRRYVAALGAVLAAVHLLLLADHWLILIAAWSLVGTALQHLLCFYPDRPFARLAAHKKRLADRAADGMLVLAAALAWSTVGSGSLSDLWLHLDREGASASLQASALALVLAAILRTALLPVHGWLIQVMEAPTPVSALLHAGVVNLGGFVLIRFSPLLEQAPAARALLLCLGLGSAVLAGMVMLTRISIKVRLAWSTTAQMGFMLLECALGLYTLAALHLLGHSLYKAHAFLAASNAVRETRQLALHRTAAVAPLSLLLAPILGLAVVSLWPTLLGQAPWPWWWSAILGLAWAPLLWVSSDAPRPLQAAQAGFGLLIVLGLTSLTLLAHAWPLGLSDRPHAELGLVALLGLGALYVGLAWLRWRPHGLENWRRWSYAGFYVDEAYTRLALRIWPASWAPKTDRTSVPAPAAYGLTEVSR